VRAAGEWNRVSVRRGALGVLAWGWGGGRGRS
jgi:hypothetical protein